MKSMDSMGDQSNKHKDMEKAKDKDDFFSVHAINRLKLAAPASQNHRQTAGRWREARFGRGQVLKLASLNPAPSNRQWLACQGKPAKLPVPQSILSEPELSESLLLKRRA